MSDGFETLVPYKRASIHRTTTPAIVIQPQACSHLNRAAYDALNRPERVTIRGDATTGVVRIINDPNGVFGITVRNGRFEVSTTIKTWLKRHGFALRTYECRKVGITIEFTAERDTSNS